LFAAHRPRIVGAIPGSNHLSAAREQLTQIARALALFAVIPLSMALVLTHTLPPVTIFFSFPRLLDQRQVTGGLQPQR
jgi:hypothetical protein